MIALLTGVAVFASPSSRADSPDALLGQLPPDGLRFATQAAASPPADPGRFIIGEVDASGLKILTDEPHSDYRAMLWLDRRRLLVLGGDAFTDDVFAALHVDGGPSAARVRVPNEAWGLKFGEELELGIELGRDGRGGVWLVSCLRADDKDPSRCRGWIGLPLDPESMRVGAVSRKAPPGLVAGGARQAGTDPARFKGLKAPPGWELRFHKTDITDGSAMMGTGRGVPAFTCKSPDGTATWPTAEVVNWEFSVRPQRAHWIMHEPPLFVISGPTTSPIGQSGRGTLAFVGCSSQALGAFALTGTPVWFELRHEPGDHWVVRVGPHVLGQLPGSERFVLAPQR